MPLETSLTPGIKGTRKKLITTNENDVEIGFRRLLKAKAATATLARLLKRIAEAKNNEN